MNHYCNIFTLKTFTLRCLLAAGNLTSNMSDSLKKEDAMILATYTACFGKMIAFLFLNSGII